MPVTLVILFPTQISLVAVIYLLSKLGTVFVSPWLFGVIDKWRRLHTAILGTTLQLTSVLLVTLCVVCLASQKEALAAQWNNPTPWALVTGIILGSVTANLGAGLMDTSVGNDWIPTLVPPQQLAAINSRLKQLDLLTEVLSPLAAGLLLAFRPQAMPLAGFLLVALWNFLSFAPELALLRSVFRTSVSLQSMTQDEGLARARQTLPKKLTLGWRDFRHQLAALAMLSYAFLWLSALSPHGVLLTAFLKSGWTFSETELGLFRGLGALFGLTATLAFPRVRARLGLVRGTRFFIVFQACVLLCSLPFFFFGVEFGWVFLALVLLSRIGLYGFSLGESEIRQRTIPEGQRGRVNGVASALTSLATIVLFGLGAVFSNPENFFAMVLVSVIAVCAGAALFVFWSRRLTTEDL